MADEDWLRVTDVNVNGVFWCSRAFGRHMIQAGRGAIVNLGSMSGTICNRPQPQTPYNVSKAAVHHMTRSMAAEWARHGVRVNAVAPTYIETPMVHAVPTNRERIPLWLADTPMGRMGQAYEVAEAENMPIGIDRGGIMFGEIAMGEGRARTPAPAREHSPVRVFRLRRVYLHAVVPDTYRSRAEQRPRGGA